MEKSPCTFPCSRDLDRGTFLVARPPRMNPGLANAMSSEIHAVDPTVVVYGIRTMQDRLYDSLARQRFASTMLGAFAIFALLLAAVGLYGVMSFLVTQSTHDIGILVALGARRENILSPCRPARDAVDVHRHLRRLIGAVALTRAIAACCSTSAQPMRPHS